MEETSLTVFAQVAMLNHANILSVAKAPPKPKENVYLAFKGYSEKDMVDLKARGVELLQAFMADSAASIEAAPHHRPDRICSLHVQAASQIGTSGGVPASSNRGRRPEVGPLVPLIGLISLVRHVLAKSPKTSVGPARWGKSPMCVPSFSVPRVVLGEPALSMPPF